MKVEQSSSLSLAVLEGHVIEVKSGVFTIRQTLIRNGQAQFPKIPVFWENAASLVRVGMDVTVSGTLLWGMGVEAHTVRVSIEDR